MKNLSLTQQNKILLVSFSLFILIYLILGKKPNSEPREEKKVYADTMIPKGFVLVPIELVNVEAVASLIDQFGVIDLYAGHPTEKGSYKLASKIKILRAPLNPNQYAVLAPELLSTRIMKAVGPFWAIVQNRATVSNYNEPIKNKVQIEYFKGD